MGQIIALAAPHKRLSVQFREDLALAQETIADNQFKIIHLVFSNGTSGVIYDWQCKRTIRWNKLDTESIIHWHETEGKRFSYEVGRFFLHEKEEGDEAE